MCSGDEGVLYVQVMRVSMCSGDEGVYVFR